MVELRTVGRSIGYLLVLTTLVAPLFGQTPAGTTPSPAKTAPTASPASTAAGSTVPREPGVLFYNHIDQDLSQSSLADLQAWAKSLGLPGGADKASLVAAIRAYYKAKLSASALAWIEANQPSPSPTPVVKTPSSTPAPSGTPTPKPAAGPSAAPAQLQPVVAPNPTPAPPKAPNHIVIDRADRASYVKLDVVNETYIRLRGGVHIRVEDNTKETVHDIWADSIVINQEDELMSANGNIRYLRTGKTQTEEFTGSELFFNGKTYEIYLFDATSKTVQTGTAATPVPGAAPSPTPDNSSAGSSEQKYKSRTTYRSPDEVSVMRDMSLSSSVWDPPAYHISAKSMYLLQPGEWFLEDATLYVGNIPVFYFPYFYNPSDSLLFHPTTGVRTLEGAYIQTTTYFLGQKPPDDAFLELLKVSLPDNKSATSEELKGLFLRKTRKLSKDTGTGTGKILADVYTQLGYFLGAQVDFKNPAGTGLRSFTSKVGLAWARNLYTNPTGNGYISYYLGGGQATQVWQQSNFGGLSLPFRYYLDASTEIGLGPLTLKIGLPIYSDGNIVNDFGNRTESIEWGKLLKISPESTTTTTTTTTSSLTSLDWSLSLVGGGNLFTFPPLLETVTVNRFEFHAVWKAVSPTDIAAQDEGATNRSNGSLFVPNYFLLPGIGLALSGTLFNLSVGPPVALKPLNANLVSPWAKDEPPPTAPKTGDSATPSATTPPAATAPPAIPPVPEVDPAAPGYMTKIVIPPAAFVSPLDFKLGYSVVPVTETKAVYPDNTGMDRNHIRYSPSNWSYSLNSVQSLTGTIGLLNTLWRTNETVSWTERYYSAFGFDPTLDATQLTQIKTDAAGLNSTLVAQNFNSRFQPFVDGFLRASNLYYELNSTLMERKFSALDQNGGPRYDTRNGGWGPADITSHKFQANLIGDLAPLNQSLSFEQILAPQTPKTSMTSTTSLNTDFLTLSSQVGVHWYPDNQPTQYDDLTLRARLVADPKDDWFWIDQTVSIDLNTSAMKRYELTARLKPFSVGLVASSNTYIGYTFDSMNSTYVAYNLGEAQFQFESVRLGVQLDVPTVYGWSNRVSQNLSLKADYNQSFVDVRNATLTASLTYTLKVFQFLDVNLSVNSENKRMYQYFPALANRLGLPTVDLLSDLANSFNFFDSSKRQGSSFKLQSINLTLRHYLADWTLDVAVKGLPKATTSQGKTSYTWDSSFSISLAWTPLPLLKNSVTSDSTGTTIK